MNRIPIEPYKELCPPDFYEWVKAIYDDLGLHYTRIEKRCMQTLAQVDRTMERKDQADFIKNQPNSGIVFKMLDGQEYRDIIWKQLKPEAEYTFIEKV